MFATNSQFYAGSRRTSSLGGQTHQFAYAFPVDGNKRIVFQYPLFAINLDKRSGVVSRQAESRLRQIVGAEAEKFRRFGDLACSKGSAWQFDHGANGVLDLAPFFPGYFFGCLINQLLQDFEFWF